MNRFVNTIKKLDLAKLQLLLDKEPGWIKWEMEDGKNALHFLGARQVKDNAGKMTASVAICRLLLKKGMDVNSIHRINDEGCIFPATPLWYAYAKGRNKKLVNFLLSKESSPENCMYAIAWNDDVAAAEKFSGKGAAIDLDTAGGTPFLAAFNWKRFNIAKWFIKKGADINASDPKGNTALHYAIIKKYRISDFEWILKQGAAIDKENYQHLSPRKIAEQQRRTGILQLFSKYSS